MTTEKENDISLCQHCHCMTKKVIETEGHLHSATCGKCGMYKDYPKKQTPKEKAIEYLEREARKHKCCDTYHTIENSFGEDIDKAIDIALEEKDKLIRQKLEEFKTEISMMRKHYGLDSNQVIMICKQLDEQFKELI